MGLKLQPQEFPVLRDFIAEISGNLLADGKEYLIESRLGDLALESGCHSFTELYHKARGGGGKELRNRIVDGITINETLWFRDQHPFTILREKLLPELARQVREGQRSKIRIWSAASSTGQEAYSTAMLICEFARTTPQLRPEMFEIVGTDICDTALAVAKKGSYDRVVINRGLPPDLRKRYFQEDDRQWRIGDEIKKMVSFRNFNLMDSFSTLGRFDVIFCRYVAIYFSREGKVQLYNKIAKKLNPGGVLFLGASEFLSVYSDDFSQSQHQKGVYYQLASE